MNDVGESDFQPREELQTRSSARVSDSLGDEYRERFDNSLGQIAEAISEHLQTYLAKEPRIDRVTARAKSPDRFLQKATIQLDGHPKYSEPLRQVQDQIGARIVVFFHSDVERVCKLIEKYFRPIEAKQLIPESEWEFGYFGTHYVLIIPEDVVPNNLDRRLVPEFFELQVKTLFQHAWSEANHDLGYKPGSRTLTSDAVRRLAFTSAQAWGADIIFSELFANTQSKATA